MPAIRSIVSHIQGFIDKLNGMDESQKKAIITIGLVVAAIGPLLVIIGTVISKVGVAMQGFVKLAGAFNKIKAAASAGTGIFGKLGAAIGGVSAPVLAVVAVIAVLVAAFVHLWNTNEGFREAILGTWEKIKTTVSNFVRGIRERLAALGISFSDIAETIKAIWNGRALYWLLSLKEPLMLLPMFFRRCLALSLASLMCSLACSPGIGSRSGQA